MVNLSSDYSSTMSREQTISVNGLENTIYKLTDKDAAPIIGYMPDTHVSTGSIDKMLHELADSAKGYKRVYLELSDVDDKTKSRLDFFEENGLVDDKAAELNFISNKLGEVDGSAFNYIQTIEKFGGIEKYLNLVEESGHFIDRDNERTQYTNTKTHLDSIGLEEKIQEISQNMTQEEQEGFLLNNLKNRAFTYGCTAHNMEKVAKVLDDYNAKVHSGEKDLPEIVVITGGGNHDSVDSYETLNNSTSQTMIHHINNIGGAIELGSEDEKIAFQLASNCYTSTPIGDSFGLSAQEIITQTSPHTHDFTLMQNYDPNNSEDMPWEEIKQNSLEYQRLTLGGTEKQSLDFMLYHQEMGDNAEGYGPLTAAENLFTNLGLVAHQNEFVNEYDNTGLKRTYSGHFHSEVEGHIDEKWGQIRNRFTGSIINKSGHERVEVGSISGPVHYDKAEVLKHAEIKFTELINQLNAQEEFSDGVADDYYDEDEKAA